MMLVGGCSNSSTSKQQVIADEAHILEEQSDLTRMYYAYNAQMLKDFDIDFRIVTTFSDEPINTFANTRFNELQKNSRSQSGKALLLVINILHDSVRLEVSMGLEAIYTDAFVSYIERKGFVPYFRDRKITDGVYAATELVRDRAYEAQSGKVFMPPMQSRSMGGGAQTKAHIGEADPHSKSGEEIQATTQHTPAEALSVYVESLKTHNKNPNLSIFTEATKTFFRNWTVTDINQNNEVRFISQCDSDRMVFYASDGKHAVLRNDIETRRACSPYFFQKVRGSWKLDFATMARTLRFNASMHWHFDLEERLKEEGKYYAFAFDGYGFDKNGYAFKPEHYDHKKMRWGFQCSQWYLPKDREHIKKSPQKYTKCWISNCWHGMPAIVRLGLTPYDYVIAIGEGESYRSDISYDAFMEYMAHVPSGSLVTIEVIYGNQRIQRQGIAP
jgi:uncharacterized protein